MTDIRCSCGAPAHPVYNGRCEDCWIKANSGGGSGLLERQVKLFQPNSDRRWCSRERKRLVK